MKALRLFWLSTAILLLLCVWQVYYLQRLMRQQEADPEDASVTQRYHGLLASVQAERDRLLQLEAAVFDSQNDLLSWLTTQASELDASIVSTSQLPLRKETTYEWHPMELEIEGRYDALSRLIHQMEQQRPLVNLNAIRVFVRQSAPTVPVLQMIVRTLQKAGDGPSSHQAMRATQPALWVRGYTYPTEDIRRNPFLLPPSPSKPTPMSAIPREWPTLSAILWDTDTPTAIIEFQGKSIRSHPGMVVGDVLVAKIEPNGVILKRENERREVMLWPGIQLGIVDGTAPRKSQSAEVSSVLGRLPGALP